MGGFKKKVRCVDWLFWNYNVIVAVLLLLRGHHVDGRWLYLLSNLFLIFLSIGLIFIWRTDPESTGKRFLRDWYPFGYFFYLHWESGMIGNVIFQGTFDALVEQWGNQILGSSLHQILYNFQPLWFSEFIHFTYFFYYILILIPPILLYTKEDSRFYNYVFDISLLYLIHYTLFYIFPVVGPIEQHLTKFSDGLLFIPLMKLIYYVGDSPGGAMPSSHVSVAILAWVWVYKIKRTYALSILLFTVSLIFATVYLSYHYAIDSIIGLFMGTLFVIVMESLRNNHRHDKFW